jgi:hypothetical protein
VVKEVSRIQVADESGIITPEMALELQRMFSVEKYSGTQIADKGSNCNGSRFESKVIWNSTTKRPLWSSGDSRTDTWINWTDTITPS